MKAFKIISFLILILSLSVSVFGQDNYGKVGKIFTKAEADKEFGPVLYSKTIDLSTIQTVLSKVNDYIMFSIKNDSPVITDKSRNVVYSTKSLSLRNEDVLHMYSVSVFKELLSKGNSKTVVLEKRETVFSVANGAYVMEVGLLCPPICE